MALGGEVSAEGAQRGRDSTQDRALLSCAQIRGWKSALPHARTHAQRKHNMAAEGNASQLVGIVTLLGAAVVAVPLFKRLGLGAVLGYLAAGLAIGPYGLGLVTDAQTILHVAELGVVMFLFVIGLEMKPSHLWDLRGQIFGLGSLQVVVCACCAWAWAGRWPLLRRTGGHIRRGWRLLRQPFAGSACAARAAGRLPSCRCRSGWRPSGR